jgi:hypothetical protein
VITLRERAAHSAPTIAGVILASLAAALPLMGGRLPWAADTLIHLYRLVELDHLLRQGYVFSRWAPDLAYGFGFPLFNFYAPLSYYAAEIFCLVGMDFSPALLATFAAFVVGAGLGMYLWTAEIFGRQAGLVAAAAYVTAPYLLYNIYHRGALAEVLAMALMPAILWAITRLARTGSPYLFALAALLYAALPLGHNITWFIFTPVVVLYAALQATQNTKYLLHVALSLLLGLGLSAFFWLPAILELNSVQIIQVFLPQVFDYHFNFVTLGELFSPPVTVDPNLLLPATPRSIGLIPLALAILALVFGWKRWNRHQKILAGSAAVLVVGSLFLTLPQSLPAWDALPLLRYVQFPWRFLGLASLAVAFLAGGVFAHHSSLVTRHSSFVIVAGFVVYGFTWQYVPYLAPIVRPTVADIAHYERESGALGTTSAGDFMPNTVKKLPDANLLVERYSRSDVIERLDSASLPPNAKILQADYRLLSSDVTVESQSSFVATFDIFYFAGWQARVDGRLVAITPTDPNGLISFPVPVGQHRLQVFFGSTPLRTAAGIVSLISALTLIVMSVVFVRQGTLVRVLRQPSQGSSLHDLHLATCILLIGLIAFKLFYLDSHETIFRRTRFDGTHVAGVAHQASVNFDDRMALIGYEPETLTAQMGGSVHLVLYWRAMRQLDADYSISVQIVDERGFVYGQRDSQHPGGYPTSRWATSSYVHDVHDIALLPGTPPGQYHLHVGVYRMGVSGRLNVLDANGAPAGTTVDLATFQVVRPGPMLFPAKLPAPNPTHPLNGQLAPGIVLVGYDLPLDEINVGDGLPFTLYWQAASAQTRDLEARMQLVGTDNEVVALGDVAPISAQFPTGRLLAGDVLRGPNAVRIPASMPSGTYTLRVSLVDESGAAGKAADLGRVTVRVPPHTLTAPHVEHPSSANLGDQVSLIGYDVKSQISNLKSQIEVVLYWQALREMTDDYKAFVHLLDATGRLIVGSDAVPADWTRPTTGWIAGEYVADAHTLSLPADLAPGDYRLEVGMYDAESNVRLGESVLLDQVIVIAP